jgi:hypothetical protein
MLLGRPWKFINNFSGICAPIIDTIKKKHKSFNWTKEAAKSSRVLKKKITKQLILVLLDFGKTFKVRCDASGIGIGAVLSQDNRPADYFSEKLNDAKEKYYTYEKEFYTVIQSLKKWRYYLIPKEFVLYSDNKALQFITTQEEVESKAC